jgi:hypothetical protein
MSEWQEFILPWEGFAQEGFGERIWTMGGTIDHCTDIEVEIPVQSQFDFWIAGFGYYKAADWPPPP